MHSIKLGTRKSLLALAQSGWVAREIERLNPGTKVELVGIETRGDRIQDVPLSSVQGKEFFVAELDDALKSGRSDVNVHSMKDLSLDRPREFVTGAIPKRENPRDAVLFGPGVLEKIARGGTLRIGTSSPRRLENIPPFLERALPRINGQRAKLEFVEIRGNVNTRLGRVHLPPSHEKHLDAVVLAFAGLARLHLGPDARAELEGLLKGVRWMLLPVKENPSAPAQGALAVECRADDTRTREALARLHDAHTAAQVARERQILSDWGGGCHQKFGASCISTPQAGELLYVRGKKPDGEFVEELRWEQPAAPSGPVRAWDGHDGDSRRVPMDASVPPQSAWFVAHSRALPEGWERPARVWTSGSSSWFRLAERGVWVEGSAEGLGFEAVRATLEEPVLQLPRFSDWAVLTHADAEVGWHEFGARVFTYRVEAQPPMGLANATHVFWASGSQAHALAPQAPAAAEYACGSGKSAETIRKIARERGWKLKVFPSVEEWRKWITKA